MHSQCPTSDSYWQYLEFCSTEANTSLARESTAIIERFQTQQPVPSRFAPVIYLLDYTARKYIYVDEGCFEMFGYTAAQWKEDSIEGYLKKWHPQDMKVMNDHIFPQTLKLLKDVPLHKYENVICSYNYRVQCADGNYVTILQRSSFIPGDEPAKPRGAVGAAFDITHFKTDLSIVHTIEEVQPDHNAFVNKILYKMVYPVTDGNQLLISRRQLDVLRRMANGLSSKQIADELNLSVNTVNNHRKNMLSKTRCKSSVELLSFALKNKYL